MQAERDKPLFPIHIVVGRLGLAKVGTFDYSVYLNVYIFILVFREFKIEDGNVMSYI